jgi:signal transduction histidine kinase
MCRPSAATACLSKTAVLNLLFNAREAMPDGGLICVGAAAITEAGMAFVQLRVADKGIGMKPETIERAFDPYFTTKTDGLGGVGLSMVKRFAEDAGGKVSIESEFGVGTTVRYSCPHRRSRGPRPIRKPAALSLDYTPREKPHNEITLLS